MLSDDKLNKIKIIIEIIIFVVILIITFITKGIPLLKKSLGSSDIYYNVNNYSSVVGIEVKDEADFALVLSDDKVEGLLFFNDDALILYNKNIEKNDLNKSLDTITSLIDEYSINNIIKVINYGQNNDIYDKIKLYMNSKYNNKVIYSNGNLQDKAKQLGIETTDKDSAIEDLYNYSNRVVKNYKNNLITENIITIDKNKAKTYAINIYKKLLVYAEYVDNQQVNDDKYPIQLIEVDDDVIETGNNELIVPDSNSWYYIKDGIVYAYIEFSGDKDYGFCFSGNIDSMKEGNCSEKFS